MRIFYIGFFGLIGVYARYFVGLLMPKLLIAPSFPFATLSINILGSFLIGVIYVIGIERSAISSDLRIGIIIGLLGGFTTFSTYCMEIAQLIEEGELSKALLYFGLSSFFGILAVFLGLFLGRSIS